MNVKQKLDRLYGLKSELFSTFKEQHELIDEHESKIIEIERNIAEKSTGLQEEIQRLEGEIVQETLIKCEAVTGNYLQAIYTKAAVTFDSKKFKVEQPSLYASFSKVGEPRVRITAVENGR